MTKKEEVLSGATGVETGKRDIASLEAELINYKKITAEHEKKMAMLMSIADKRALNNYYLQNKQKIITSIRLRVYNGKIVKEWEVVKNEVEKDVNTGRYSEDQKIKLIFEDGSNITVPYITFSKSFEYEEFDKKSISIDDETGDEILTLISRKNGTEISVSSKFVN